MHLYRQERMSADVEEVLITANSRNLQNPFPDLGDRRFEGAAGAFGRFVSGLVPCGRCVLLFAVDLPIGRQREARQLGKRRGDHELGQSRAQCLA